MNSLDPQSTEIYDAVIVGSGFGGAMCARSLVDAGWRVLMIERGGWARRDEKDWDPREILIDQRYQSRSPLLVRQYGAKKFAQVPATELVGGQSVLYGGASLRLRPADFARWPLSYPELEPFYARAERLLGVHGQAGADPTEPPRTGPYPFAPIEPSPPARRMFQAARRAGLHPFLLPLAINFRDTSRALCVRCNTCDGFPCKIAAKNDVAATVLLRLQQDGLELVTGTAVDSLGVEHGQVRQVNCVDAATGAWRRVRGRVVVLAAGAVHSPAILLRSGRESFAQEDLIGRYLMRHCNAVAAGVFPFRTNPQQVFHKQMCVTDLYEQVRSEWGTAVGVIQDIYTPDPQVLRYAAPAGLRTAAAWSAGFLQNLLCIAEDEPRRENRVSLAPQRDELGMSLTRIEHEYTPQDEARRDHLLRAARRILRRAGCLWCHTYLIDTFSHAVGTLRAGDDPRESVVDADCRFRGVDNLYVTDASIFPASGGVNPSLTVAANALRVGEIIAREHAVSRE